MKDVYHSYLDLSILFQYISYEIFIKKREIYNKLKL